jgi:hypothetical protein
MHGAGGVRDTGGLRVPEPCGAREACTEREKCGTREACAHPCLARHWKPAWSGRVRDMGGLRAPEPCGARKSCTRPEPADNAGNGPCRPERHRPAGGRPDRRAPIRRCRPFLWRRRGLPPSLNAAPKSANFVFFPRGRGPVSGRRAPPPATSGVPAFGPGGRKGS